MLARSFHLQSAQNRFSDSFSNFLKQRLLSQSSAAPTGLAVKLGIFEKRVLLQVYKSVVQTSFWKEMFGNLNIMSTVYLDLYIKQN